jgi:prepilin-type N-terminal cleavage/methylation domain-containing protein
MKTDRYRGFTLIELLTVIAIIAILASMVMVAVPRVLEKAKITRMHNAMINIRTSLANYYTSKNTFPPAYGYVKWEYQKTAPEALTAESYNLVPYMAALKDHGNVKLYDEFSESYDTNRDRAINLLEFSPIGSKNIATGAMTFPTELYDGTNLSGEVQNQLKTTPRPFVYIPVNSKQFKKAREYWVKTGDFLATTWDAANPLLSGITFPPASYDAYVLISVGPGGSTFGVLPELIGVENAKNAYHVTALRACFLATRDLNDNGQLDFDFTARTQQGEGKLTYDVNGRPCNNMLPDPKMPNAYGPYIFIGVDPRP